MTATPTTNGKPRRFFKPQTGWNTPYSTPRSVTAAATVLPTPKVRKRKATAWQAESWKAYEAIGEVQFAFDMVSSLVSRVRLYAAIVDDPDMVPVEGSEFLAALAETGLTPDDTEAVIHAAQDVVSDLMLHSLGLGSGLLRDMATCIQVVGETYVVNHENRWIAVSSDCLQGAAGDTWKLKLDRYDRSNDLVLPEDAFVARIWKPSARFPAEPTSSMIGVLDSCEALVLLDQAMRSMTRSRLGAGIIFIPEGVAVTTGNEVEEVLVEAVTQPIADETAATSVVPLILKGPVELGDKIKRIDLARQVDSTMIEMSDRLLNRILTGIDVPKDMITGLAEVRYANAIIVTDDLFRTSVEPLVLLICDALTQAVLRPAIRKALGNDVAPDLIEEVVIWFDPSEAVTRPDRSQAANEGWDRGLLSGKAWRAARGFNELDAPRDEEQRERMTIERAMIPPDMSAVMIEAIDPTFFAAVRETGQAQAGFEDLEALLGDEAPPIPAGPGEQGGPPGGNLPSPNGQPVPSVGEDQATSGGEVEQGGFMPPRQTVPLT